MRLLGAIAVALAFACFGEAPAQAQAGLNAAEFRDLVIARALAADPDLSIQRRDALGLEITPPEDGAHRAQSVNLDRAFAEYQANPEQIEVIVGRWVRVIVNVIEAPSAERIVSILRPAAIIAAYEDEMRARGQDSPIARRPFLGDLIEVIAFDSPDSLMFATESAIADAGLSLAEAWALTDSNIAARLGSIGRYPVEGAPRLTFLSGENGLTPSLLALPDVCLSYPDGMFLVLDRNVVLTGTANPESRAEFGRAAARFASRSLSHTPFACVDGALVLLNSSDR
jgi:hypothetical protein